MATLLTALMEPPFEPLESVSFFRLTQKTLCLLLLASGRRIGDICSLSRSSRSTRSGTALVLYWIRGYLPKTHSPDFQAGSPSIRRMTSVVSKDRLLCPVRAYEIYVARSVDVLDDMPLLSSSTLASSTYPSPSFEGYLVQVVRRPGGRITPSQCLGGTRLNWSSPDAQVCRLLLFHGGSR